MMREEGIPMDTTYVGKAFTGMLQYLKDNRITDQKLLFIHTGGTPLFLIDWEKRKMPNESIDFKRRNQR